MTTRFRLGITQGDINGIGYEVIMKTLMDERMLSMCTPVVYGSPKVAAYHRKALNVEKFTFTPIKSAEEAVSRKDSVSIVNCMDDEVRVELGHSTEVGGAGALAALNAAVADLKAGHIDALITAPINKHNIQSESFRFAGHTEFLAQAFDVPESDTLMLMVGEVFRVGVVTGHIPLSQVSKTLTKELVLSKIRAMSNALCNDFGIRKPRVAVLGLNPHAGDNGLLGLEEREVIQPAIEAANAEGLVAMGPYPADGFSGSDGFSRFDGVLAMYHDQGLVPFKALNFDTGVNYTAGLPVVRTSPAHGTAYDLTGRNLANPSSFRQAVYLAIDILRQRDEQAKISANPLRPQSARRERGERPDRPE